MQYLNYTYQEVEGGLVDALSLVEHFANGEPIRVVLGDNFIESNVRQAEDDFRAQGDGAKILLKKVNDPQHFGIPELDGSHVLYLEGKTYKAKIRFRGNRNILLRRDGFRHYQDLKTIRAGELEITDVNNHYIDQCTVT